MSEEMTGPGDASDERGRIDGRGSESGVQALEPEGAEDRERAGGEADPWTPPPESGAGETVGTAARDVEEQAPVGNADRAGAEAVVRLRPRSHAARGAGEGLRQEARARPGLPRLGFLGVGWIGRMRMEAVLSREAAVAAAIGDPSPARLEELAETVPDAEFHCGPDCLNALIEAAPDGIVIATPSALHADQAMAALEAGIPVFCQKPLGRTGDETRAVVRAAKRADRLLGVDFSYRWVRGARRMRELVRNGEIGDVYSADLVFHNAYGPDKPWFYDAHQSGGGCLMDLGVHLVDLALWMTDFPEVTQVSGRLFAQGRPLRRRSGGRRAADPPAIAPGVEVEDFATVRLDLSGGTSASISCSWNLSAGCDAVIGATFYGTTGTLSLRNVGGSFYDFRTEWYKGKETHLLDAPPDDWGGRALTAWARALRESRSYDPGIERVVQVADVLDDVYSPAGRGGRGRGG